MTWKLLKSLRQRYRLYETTCEYQDVPLKMVVCYSEKLRPQKTKTLERRISKESKTLDKVMKELKQRQFACEEDAKRELEKLMTTTSYTVSMTMVRDKERILKHLNQECLFVVVSTKLSMSAAEILREYKTQSTVERKFQFLKSHSLSTHFI